jgi:hypothetical protein
MSGSQDCWIADDEETQFNTKVVIEELTRSRTIYMFSTSLPIVIFSQIWHIRRKLNGCFSLFHYIRVVSKPIMGYSELILGSLCYWLKPMAM